MISDLDRTLQQLVLEELPIKNGEIDVKFDQPTREWSARLSKPTINFFMYDVRENPQLRSHQWERLPGQNGNLQEQKRTPMRVNCVYMITAWANDPRDEHSLLTRILMALFRYPILPEDRLVGKMQNPRFDIQAKVAAHDKLTNPAEVWGALDNELRPTIPYIVTLALDPWDVHSGPIVRAYSMRAGQANQLPHFQILDEGGISVDVNFIGGRVRSKKNPTEVLEAITVAIKGTGWTAVSDVAGQYQLSGLPAGDHTLIAWPEKGKPVEKKIQIPLEAGKDYDLEL